ncbi:hypothetical protein GCM10009838_27440 [Catenulispora subtropica]|uniref:Uncharacterized protein n=1 Tax=Catenulispora subtropica TaxID=450798 RepID=A0ABP5CR98_9ACTN
MRVTAKAATNAASIQSVAARPEVLSSSTGAPADVHEVGVDHPAASCSHPMSAGGGLRLQTAAAAQPSGSSPISSGLQPVLRYGFTVIQVPVQGRDDGSARDE